MTQLTSGLRKVLEIPLVYNMFQRALGKGRALRLFVEGYVKPTSNSKILDIGCGTSDILALLPDGTFYVGYDLSERYIRSARKRFGNRGIWYCESAVEMSLEKEGTFDIVIVSGLLHHLDDFESKRVIELAFSALKIGGRFVCLENAFTDDQGRFSKFMVRHDRGRNVRTPAGYQELFKPQFSNSTIKIHHDFFFVPYTLVILEAIKN